MSLRGNGARPPLPKGASGQNRPPEHQRDNRVRRGSLKLEGLTVYRTGDDGAPGAVVEDLTLEVASGQCCMLVGPNGAGKTSLLLAMVGALPFTGTVRLGELELEARTLKELRRRVGFVFANPDEQLFCDTVHQEVAFGPEQLGFSEDQVAARVSRALDQVGLLAHAARNPHRLSLGEQRRTAVAAALATSPDAVFFDEPTASLDPLARETILSTLKRTGATTVIASHDLQAALELEAIVALLNHGRLVGIGQAVDVLSDPALLVRAGLSASPRP